MIAPGSSHPSFRSALQVPLRHKRRFLTVFLAVVGTTILVTLLMPRTYRSEGELLLRLGRENMALDPTATLGSTPILSIQQSRENEINSVIEIVRSRALIEKVVDGLSPARILGKNEGQSADREDAIRLLIKSLNVDAVRKSNVLQITYDAASPTLAQTVVDTLIGCFLEEHIRLNRTPGAQQFLSEQTASILGQLEEREEELRKLKDETGLASPEARRGIIVTRIGRLEDELLQSKAALAASEAEVKQLQQQLLDLPTTQVTEQTVGFANEAADGMRQQLYTLQLREKELTSKVTDDHPLLRAVRDQIAAAQKVFGQEKPERTQTKTGVSKAHEEINLLLLKDEPALASLRAKADRLAAQVEAEKASLAKLNDDELRIDRLQREVRLEEANYRKYVDSLEQARIDHAMAAEGKSNISIVQPATLEPRPIKPKGLVNLLLAIVLGVIGGTGAAFAAEARVDFNKSADGLSHSVEIPVRNDISRLASRQLTPANGEQGSPLAGP